MLGGILAGLGAGIFWNIIGAIRSKEKHGDDFEYNPKWLLKTVIIGAIIGGYATVTGNPVDLEAVTVLNASLMTTPIVAVVDKIVSILWDGLLKLAGTR